MCKDKSMFFQIYNSLPCWSSGISIDKMVKPVKCLWTVFSIRAWLWVSFSNIMVSKKKPTLASIHDWVLLIPAPQSLHKRMSDHYDIPLAKLPWGWFSQNSLLFWWIFGGISHSGQITLTLGCKFNFALLHLELKSISLLNRRVPIAKIFPNIAYLTIL